MEKLTAEDENIKLKYLIAAAKSQISKLLFRVGEMDSEISELKYDIKKLVDLNNNLSGVGGGDFRVVGGDLVAKKTSKCDRIKAHDEAMKDFRAKNDRLAIIMRQKEEIEYLKNEIESIRK